MIPLAIGGVAVFDRHTRLTRLEIDNTFLLAALSAALGRCIAAKIMVHVPPSSQARGLLLKL
jgi:hypothetical protein